MTTEQALAVVRRVCDTYVCNKADRDTIESALDQLANVELLAATVDDTPAGNGRHAVPVER